MSGPATDPGTPDMSISKGRNGQVGAFPVRRTLPQRERRTVGPWCFADHMGPADVSAREGLGVAPHPHIGLQTVTWLVEGEVLHRDSLGTEQVIAPGQLNLMTAGHGVSHSEEGNGRPHRPLHGLQLWVAQPESTRHGSPAFEHHAALPQVPLGHGLATVLIGEIDGTASPARRDTDHCAIELQLEPGRSEIPLRPDYEHALIVLAGAVDVGSQTLAPGGLGHLAPDRSDLALSVDEPSRVMLIGGVPLDDPLLLWWNYVARTHDEISRAHADWTNRSDRFGVVESQLSPIDVAPPPWTRRPPGR